MDRIISKLIRTCVLLLLLASAVTTASAQTTDELAATGEAIAKVDPIVARARVVESDELYSSGFDIATGIFGDPALGALGNTATGPGSMKIRDSLTAAGQRGFNASVTLHLSRNYKPTSQQVTSNDNLKSSGAKDKAHPDLKNAGATSTDQVIEADKPSGGVGATLAKPVNNGQSFQMICRGGPGLTLQADYVGVGTNSWGQARVRLDWFIKFSRSMQPPDSSGSNLQPGQCSPANFPLGSFDPTQIETQISDDGTVSGIKLYPWEKSDDEWFYKTYEAHFKKFQDFLNDPKNYWSFDVQDLKGQEDSGQNGSFMAGFSRNWKPEFYTGPQVVPQPDSTSIDNDKFQVIEKPIDLNALAARGEAIANADLLVAELRNQQAEGSSRRGFDIGIAAAERDTLPGAGKQKIHDSLTPTEQGGFDTAVSFSLERNRNADLAAKGVAIAKVDPIVERARTVETDAFYSLGFDIATGIFGDPALGATGNTATGPGSLRIRDSLSAAGQRGFNASVTLHLSRNYKL